MKNSKAIRLLSKLSEKDRRKFRKFIESPYFNESSSICSLFYFIESFKGDKYESDKLKYEAAYQDVFPGEVFQKVSIIKLLSKLFQLLESFMLHQKVDIHTLKGKLDLMSDYLDMNEIDLFESMQKDVERHLANYENLDQHFYHNMFKYQGHLASYQSMKGIRSGDINLQQLNLALDKYYIVTKLYYLCLMRNREKIINYHYKYTLKDEILDHLEASEELKNDPVISTWQTALQLLEEPENEKIYYDLKAKKGKYRLFTQEDSRAIFTFLENGTSSLFGAGEKRFQELMDLYKMQLDSGVMYFKGFLHKNILKNIVTVAIKVNQLDWARKLLSDLRSNGKIMIFPEDQALMVYNFNLASVLFHMREFDNARQLLYSEEFNDIFYKLDAYVLLLEIRYETKDFHEIESFINKFRVFIHRSKELTEKRKEIYRKFLNLYELVFKAFRESDNKKKLTLIKKLDKRLQSDEYVYELNWFKDKLEEIKKSIDELPHHKHQL